MVNYPVEATTDSMLSRCDWWYGLMFIHIEQISELLAVYLLLLDRFLANDGCLFACWSLNYFRKSELVVRQYYIAQEIRLPLGIACKIERPQKAFVG